MKCSCAAPFDDDNNGENNIEEGDQEHLDEAAFRKELLCLGFNFPSTANQQQCREADKQRKKLRNTLTSNACAILQSDVDEILSNEPRPCSTPVKMCEDSMKRHVLAGRRFNVSMMLHEVDQCDYCGRVQPGHVDPCFPKNSPYDRKHLINTHHSAWHCTCDTCNGSQYYPTRKSTVMDYNKQHHDNQTPWQYLQHD